MRPRTEKMGQLQAAGAAPMLLLYFRMLLLYFTMTSRVVGVDDLNATDLNVRAWRVGANWPEEQLPELKGRSHSAVALGGGGTRAYIGGIGLLRGLLEIGALASFKYLTGVSGGSWAVTGFSFHGVNVTDAEYLCNLTAPAGLSLNDLKKIDPKCARSGPVKITSSSRASRIF